MTKKQQDIQRIKEHLKDDPIIIINGNGTPFFNVTAYSLQENNVRKIYRSKIFGDKDTIIDLQTADRWTREKILIDLETAMQEKEEQNEKK